MMVGGRVLTTHSNKQLVLSCVIGGDDVDRLTIRAGVYVRSSGCMDVWMNTYVHIYVPSYVLGRGRRERVCRVSCVLIILVACVA